MTPMPIQPGVQSLPGKASVEQGLVVLDGPDGVAVTMTAFAASETGKSLLEAARLVEQQVRQAE
ncbi:hypothetical protein BH10PSE12_BH10PSE12_25020 [soil metagenome]